MCNSDICCIPFKGCALDINNWVNATRWRIQIEQQAIHYRESMTFGPRRVGRWLASPRSNQSYTALHILHEPEQAHRPSQLATGQCRGRSCSCSNHWHEHEHAAEAAAAAPNVFGLVTWRREASSYTWRARVKIETQVSWLISYTKRPTLMKRALFEVCLQLPIYCKSVGLRWSLITGRAMHQILPGYTVIKTR